MKKKKAQEIARNLLKIGGLKVNQIAMASGLTVEQNRTVERANKVIFLNN